MSIVKVHRYGVRSHWLGGPRLCLEAPGKPALRVATPPEFKDGIPGIWSPEELCVGSLATCYELTLVAIAQHRGLPLRAIQVDATGYVERKDGRYAFVLFELEVALETDPGREQEAEEVALLAKDRCIVASVFRQPVELRVETRAARVATEAAAGPATPTPAHDGRRAHRKVLTTREEVERARNGGRSSTDRSRSSAQTDNLR